MSRDIDKFRREMRWQPYVAVAAFLTGVAVVAGVILALTNYIH